MREAAVHAVVAQQVRVGLDGAEIVDRDDLDIGAAGLDDGAQDDAADAAKPVDARRLTAMQASSSGAFRLASIRSRRAGRCAGFTRIVQAAQR